MDPWSNRRHQQLPEADCSDKISAFEDNFKPLICDTLPDSREYLETLERKLAKLKSNPNVLQQLTLKREACMQQLLINTYNTIEEDSSLDTPIENLSILRTIAPDRQALTQGERVTLIQYDHLTNCNNKHTERGN